jgi:diguanylate cyclase (GGDEF)-like protein
MSWLLIALGLALAAAGGYQLGRRGRAVRHSALPASTDLEHALDLLRRAHAALVATALDGAGEQAAARDPRAATRDDVGRGIALARVALNDLRRHHLDHPTSAVAAAEDGIAVALVFGERVGPDAIERAQADAWRLAAGIADQRTRTARRERPTDTGTFETVQLCETIDSATAALCESVARHVDRPTAMALRDEFSGALRIARVSAGGDRRLEGTSVLPGSAIARAVEVNAPVAARSAEDLFGHPRLDRRQQGTGTAFPLRDGRRAVGALVVFGPPEHLEPFQREEVERLLSAAGPRVAHLQAIESREVRARTDELTGLPNRRGFHHTMALLAGGKAALLIVDLDYFKQVNDRHGHVAGDGALRHVAELLRRVLRAPDLAARMGGEEFGLWLPDATMAVALEVAERVRATIEATPYPVGRAGDSADVLGGGRLRPRDDECRGEPLPGRGRSALPGQGGWAEPGGGRAAGQMTPAVPRSRYITVAI